MPRNIEIKAVLNDRLAVEARAAALADQPPELIWQDDTFFNCPNGRLKLRAFSAQAGQLIFYRRSDQDGPKESFYVISPTQSPDTLRETLALAWGTNGRVRKQRTLYIVGRTRIHLDQVEGLGDFMELEVVLADHDIAENGVAQAHALMVQLGVEPAQCVAGAYVDLLAAHSHATVTPTVSQT